MTELTNQKKQAKKPLANANPEDLNETARTHVAIPLTLYSDDADYVENALDNFGDVVAKIRDDHKWTNSQMLEHLDPRCFPSTSTISRLTHKDGKRPPSAAQVFDLRRVFGISIDALADGGNPFPLERMTVEQLVSMMGEISMELSRRIRQK